MPKSTKPKTAKKAPKSGKPKASDLEFIGFDLGHGETAIGRAYSRSQREPEILEYQGQKSLVTAVAQKGRSVKIGAQAVNLSAMDQLGGQTGDQAGGEQQIWLKFKSRHLDQNEVNKPVQLFTKTLISGLTREKKIRGSDKSQFIIGCPSGWSEQDREAYKEIFEKSGLKSTRIVPESRAALMTALEQGYLNLEAARSTILIVDIGSSTTDFTYCHNLEAEDVGHNILGSGLLDSEILRINLARQAQRKKIEDLMGQYPHYRPVMEYWCRQAKEQYFDGTDNPVEIIKRLPIAGGVLFEIRIDKDDADEILGVNLDSLNGFSWPDAFDFALRETIEQLGGRNPEAVLLTGGASRLPLVGPACKRAFPKARIIQGAEPEFAIARGLAWLGRFETLHEQFKQSVSALLATGGPIQAKAQTASRDLGARIAPVLVDALSENCVLPAFADWRSGRIKTLEEVEPDLEARVKDWLGSEAAQNSLRPVIDDWFAALQRDIEKDTDPLCREHGFPAMVLSLDDSGEINKYLEDMSVSAPQVAGLESDTAIAGTTLSAILVGVLLAKANLLAPLLANPIGLALGGVVAGGGYLFGKKALEGKMKTANIPLPMRQIMTDGRIKKAAEKQRPDMIRAVNEAWNAAASDRFTDQLITTLRSALLGRADDRAVLFLI